GALNTRLHRLENLIGFLESSARRRPHVQTELPGIHQREKVLSCEHDHDEGAGEEHAELYEHKGPMSERPVEHGTVFFAHHLKAPVERAMDAPEDIAAAM